jgi:hypothetical protein
MNHPFSARTKAVAGGRLASSAQPPRATSAFTHRTSSQHGPQPFPSASFLDTPDALLEGLRRFTAFRPLPTHLSFFSEIQTWPVP